MCLRRFFSSFADPAKPSLGKAIIYVPQPHHDGTHWITCFISQTGRGYNDLHSWDRKRFRTVEEALEDFKKICPEAKQ